MSQSDRYASFLTIFDDVRRRRLVTPEFAASIDGFRPEELVTRAWDRSTASDPVDRMMSTDVLTYLADVTVNQPYGVAPVSVDPVTKLPQISGDAPSGSRQRRRVLHF